MRAPWTKKPLLVEWDLTGDEDHGFGAVVFLTAAPVHLVETISPVYRTYDEVSAAVQRWLSTVPDRYLLNTEFQDFKATARRFDDTENSGRNAGEWWRALD